MMQKIPGCFVVGCGFLMVAFTGFIVFFLPLGMVASYGRSPRAPGEPTDIAAGIDFLGMLIVASLLCGLIGVFVAVRYLNSR